MSQLDPLPINPSVTRVLLTYIRAAKYVDQSELEQKLCVICDELGVPPASLDEVVHHLNHTISFSGFKIDRCLDEVSNTLVYAFVNSSSISTQVDKTLSRFKVSDLEIIKFIIDEVFVNDYHANVDSLVNSLLIKHHVSRTSKELRGLISKLINLGYFEVERNFLVGTARLLMELRSYLNKYQLAKCATCDNIVTRGVQVETRQFHYKCFDIYKRSNDVDPTQWTYIGLQVART